MLSEISQTERQILYDLTYMWDLKKIKLIETEIRFVVATGQGGEGDLGVEVQKVQTSSCKINKFWGCRVLQDHYS